VRVPVNRLVGKENEGWRLITTQLNHERVMLGPAGRMAALYDRVHAWAEAAGLLNEPDVQHALHQTRVAMRVNELLNWQVATASTVDIADASATKVFSSERLQRLGELLEDVAGRRSAPVALRRWLDVQTKRNLVLTFGGGVNEIQRELIATAGLGLPRVPR
jgi:alkylation response protein AidB-like acyl-CoA dehydrogenase